MPYEGEDPPLFEPDGELNELSHQVLGAALEVAKLLEPGLDEKVYEAALCVELRLRQIPFTRQVVIPVYCKSEQIGAKTLDLLIAGR